MLCVDRATVLVVQLEVSQVLEFKRLSSLDGIALAVLRVLSLMVCSRRGRGVAPRWGNTTPLRGKSGANYSLKNMVQPAGISESVEK